MDKLKLESGIEAYLPQPISNFNSKLVAVSWWILFVMLFDFCCPSGHQSSGFLVFLVCSAAFSHPRHGGEHRGREFATSLRLFLTQPVFAEDKFVRSEYFPDEALQCE